VGCYTAHSGNSLPKLGDNLSVQSGKGPGGTGSLSRNVGGKLPLYSV
jgi:hypothetical protein